MQLTFLCIFIHQHVEVVMAIPRCHFSFVRSPEKNKGRPSGPNSVEGLQCLRCTTTWSHTHNTAHSSTAPQSSQGVITRRVHFTTSKQIPGEQPPALAEQSNSSRASANRSRLNTKPRPNTTHVSRVLCNAIATTAHLSLSMRDCNYYTPYDEKSTFIKAPLKNA